MKFNLQQYTHWIFDMDGTLTLGIHDFDAIRAELGLPEGKPILEALAELPATEAQRLHQQLDEIELEIARQSTAAPGAESLLSALTAKGYQLGILTRNNEVNITATLKAAGLDHFFEPKTLISRNCAAPKPDPAGIHLLLNHWQAAPDKAVMLGDHLFDLTTGRAAGTATIHIDRSGEFPHQQQADLSVQELDELLPCLTSS